MQDVVLRLLLPLTMALPMADARAQQLDERRDVLFRASYCFGVVAEMHQVYASNLAPLRRAFSRSLCDDWQEARFQSKEACAEQRSQEALAGARVKMDRFGAYLDLQRPALGSVEIEKMQAMVAKGRIDQLASSSRYDNRDTNCSTGCRNTSNSSNDVAATCVADCIGRYDPTQARIFRCVVLPDRLPF